MKIDFQVFGPLKDFFPAALSADFGEGATVHDALLWLSEKNLQAGFLLSHCSAAVNDAVVSRESPLTENMTLMILPPASGG